MRSILSTSFVFAVLVTTTVLVAAGPAGACSCAPPSEAEAFEAADVVFIGSVERIYDARSGSSTNPEVVVLRVSDVYKGDVTQTQGIVTQADGASCGFDFQPGGVYVVFAGGASDFDVEPGFHATALCEGTRLLDDRAPELGVNPTLPQEGGPSVATIQDQLGPTRTSLFPEALIFVGVLGFILGLAAWFSRKGRPAT